MSSISKISKKVDPLHSINYIVECFDSEEDLDFIESNLYDFE